MKPSSSFRQWIGSRLAAFDLELRSAPSNSTRRSVASPLCLCTCSVYDEAAGALYRAPDCGRDNTVTPVRSPPIVCRMARPRPDCTIPAELLPGAWLPGAWPEKLDQLHQRMRACGEYLREDAAALEQQLEGRCAGCTLGPPKVLAARVRADDRLPESCS